MPLSLPQLEVLVEGFLYCSLTSWTPLFAIPFTTTFLPSSDFMLRMSLKELIECKHPTAWIEFEKGMIDEVELSRIFFKDGRSFDLEGMKNCMRRGYSYIEGVEELLHALKQNKYEIHAFTNYPIWYKMIEDKLKVSRYLSWTFCSCING
ncbi:hypothetical protein I3760_08G118100 [Carya illinoinensis]|nr:hypothetical protein I3760_08G118100 [Carya illinoinensis]